MPNRLSDVDIEARLMPTSRRWPSSETARTIAWDCLRELPPALHGLARALDNSVSAIEADKELSPEGIKKRRADLGLKALKELAAYKPYADVEKAIQRDRDTITKNMTGMPKPPETVAEAVEATELRAFIRGQKSPADSYSST